MTEPRKLRVFLCHASQDKPIVRELYQRLLAEGWIDPWLDEEKLLPGQDWDMEIEKAVENADAIVVCLSNTSVSKEGYVQKELKVALTLALYKPEETIFIVPMRLNECSLPRNLRSIQYIDYFPKAQKGWAYERLRLSLKTRYDQQVQHISENQDHDDEKFSGETEEEKSNQKRLPPTKQANGKRQNKNDGQIKKRKTTALPNNKTKLKQPERQEYIQRTDLKNMVQENISQPRLNLVAWQEAFRRGDLYFALPLMGYLIVKGLSYLFEGIPYIVYLDGYLPFIAGFVLLIRRVSFDGFAARAFMFLFLIMFSLIQLGAIINSDFLLGSFFYAVFGIIAVCTGIFTAMQIYTARSAPFFAIMLSLFISLESYTHLWGRLITGNFHSTLFILMVIGFSSAILLVFKK